MGYDTIVVSLQGPRSWPGSLAVNKMAEALLMTFEGKPGISIVGPEWTGTDGEASFLIEMDDVFDPKEDIV